MLKINDAIRGRRHNLFTLSTGGLGEGGGRGGGKAVDVSAVHF